ncbi:MAG TPA: tryptophan-rich sensory protein, partial [Clostridiales bacterium]|nr:tryptophan-rich sensory protein [Clostridiales bacterium]
PSFVFPIVWSVLYILMGVSAYMVYSSEAKSKNTALKIYGVQLLLNSIWPLIFFNM